MDEKKLGRQYEGIKPMFQGKMQPDSQHRVCQRCTCRDETEKAKNGSYKAALPK